MTQGESQITIIKNYENSRIKRHNNWNENAWIGSTGRIEMAEKSINLRTDE